MSRILLTGAAGFVGSHLADRLLQDGHEVLGADNLSTGRRTNIGHLDDHARFTFLQADVSQPLRIEGALDWILHFASPASPPKYLGRPIDTLRVNAEGTRHLLDLARAKGASFFLASTSEVYGSALVHPQVETYNGNVNPVGPRSVYTEAKRYAEALTTAYHTHHGLEVRIVRIFNTYGPRMDPADGRVVTNLLMQALQGKPLTLYGNGTQTRSFCYVSDLVEGVVRMLESGDSRPLNLGNAAELTMLELTNVVKRLTGSASPIRFDPMPEDDPNQRRPDLSRARQLLRWEAQVAIEEGLRRTMEHLRTAEPSLAFAGRAEPGDAHRAGGPAPKRQVSKGKS